MDKDFMKTLTLVMFTILVYTGSASADTALYDAVRALQTVAGTTAVQGSFADIDHDGRLGMPDAAYALQSAAGLRPADDPLFAHQWHLRNSGQKTFSQSAGTAGEDLRMTKAMADGLTGEGVIVAVVDSGLDILHEDLASNVVTGGSWNYLNQTTDPTATNADGDHGTSVAGIIAAAAKNGKGGRGVAPKASLKGFNALETNQANDYVASLGGHDRSKDVHIFNMSYGDEGLQYMPMAPVFKTLLATVPATLRGGKGAIYVKSAGNEYSSFEVAGKEYKCTADMAYPEPIRGLDVTCQNVNGAEENTPLEMIVVGATNAAGKRASYSSAGSALWIAAPGGEYGTDSPAILTADQSGCDKGYSRSRNLYTGEASPANDFQTGEASGDGRYNPGCNYTSAFNGTSSAAPNVSGAIALILTANPDLSWRDVKHILAKTARQIDSGTTARTVDIGAKTYEAEQAWITNAAGYHFHNWYGFGAIDVDAAIAMAVSRPLPFTLGTLQKKTFPPLPENQTIAIAIPDAEAGGATHAITVPDADDLVIESVTVFIGIEHPNTGEIAIELESPAGTGSIVLNLRSSLKSGLYRLDDQQVLQPAAMTTNAFYGEYAKGEWVLRVVDGVANNTGTLKHVAIVITGH